MDETDGRSRTAGKTRFRGHRRFAAFWDRAVQRENPAERQLRRETAAHLSGRVLEVGVGVGANWQYLPDGIEYVGVEPDPYMIERARTHAREAGKRLSLQQARAEALPFDDGSFDSVLITLTLCTVTDPDAALAEVRRVLRPGGTLAFFEHVRPDGRLLGPVFDGITPAWRRVAAGCHPNRRTLDAIGDAGFALQSPRRQRVRGIPMIVGTARKPAS